MIPMFYANLMLETTVQKVTMLKKTDIYLNENQRTLNVDETEPLYSCNEK